MDNKLYANLERTIAHSDEVERILGDHAFDKLLIARARLARHKHLGEHRVTQTHGGVDFYINLEGPAAVSVEEGHHNHWDGSWVEGLHIVKGAIWNVG